MINLNSVATLGVGFGNLAISTLGFITAQIEFIFNGGILSEATLRVFDSIATEEQFEVKLDALKLSSVVQDVVSESTVLDISFENESSSKSFFDTVEKFTLDETSDVSNDDVVTLRTFISTSKRRN